MGESTGLRSGLSTEDPLPVVGSSPPERADAARNREKALAAAARLFRDRGIENVSMDAVAKAAGVGKGTLYRRFGDRAGLALALLDERERELQENFIRGPAPLGPGAPPPERLLAFFDALLELLESHGDLIRESEGSGLARFDSVYASYHAHVAMLIREARDDLDADYLAHALLAPLSGGCHRAFREQGIAPERMRAGLETLVRGLLDR